MCDLLENSVIHNFQKNQCWHNVTEFCDTFHSISWQFSNQPYAMYINVGMKNIPNRFFYKIFNILPSYF